MNPSTLVQQRLPDGTCVVRVHGCEHCRRWTKCTHFEGARQYPNHESGCEFGKEKTGFRFARVMQGDESTTFAPRFLDILMEGEDPETWKPDTADGLVVKSWKDVEPAKEHVRQVHGWVRRHGADLSVSVPEVQVSNAAGYLLKNQENTGFTFRCLSCVQKWGDKVQFSWDIQQGHLVPVPPGFPVLDCAECKLWADMRESRKTAQVSQ